MSKVHTSLAKATPPATPPLHLQSKSTSLPSNFSTSTTPTTTTTTAIPPPPPPPPLQQPPSPPPPPPPPASSLPPRPPPTQAVPRKSSPTSIAPIIPALPMALVAQRGSKKSYPPPGIGRGHSSLPPKPGFVSKPLPRDTEAIVLTSGGDSLSFAAPPKGKRTYSSVASETTMRPMDPAVTNLTPQNIVSPSAPAPSHHTAPVHTAVPTAPQPRSLTPPAEPTVKKIMAGKELQDLGNLSVVGFTPTPPTGPKAARPAAHNQQQQPLQNDPRQMTNNSSGNLNANNPITDRPTMYRVDQQLPQGHDLPQHMGGFAGMSANGVLPEMFHHHMAHQFGFPPLHPHQHQQGTFYPQQPYHGGTLTPPNTGTMYMPNPLQPHMENQLYNEMVGSPDSANGNAGGGGGGNAGGGGGAAGQPHMFGPGYGYGHHSEHPAHQHSMMQHHMMEGYGHQPDNGRPQTRDINIPSTPVGDGNRVNGVRNLALRDPRLRGISFVAADDDAKASKASAATPDGVVATPKSPQASKVSAPPANQASGTPTRVPKSDTENNRPVGSSTAPLEYYMARQFLNKKLADAKLVLVRPGTHVVEVFPAHSFVLGRSDKLCNLFEHAEKADGINSNNHPSLARTNSTSSWADEVEGEEPVVPSRAIKAVLNTGDGVTTITFETGVPRTSFLMVLKTLYGVSDWELDAFLNPEHAAHHTVGQIGAMPSDANSDDTSSAAHSPMPADDESRSQQVRMLERSIQIFAAGVLLGLDDIVFKAIDNIKRWGLHLEGGAFERLLKFLLYDSEEMRSDKALSSPHWTFTDGLLEEAIDLFAHSIPDGFKIDFRAPHSKFLSRFGTGDHPPPSAVSTPAVSAANQHQRMIRQIQSTVLLSIPFDVMKQILEHNALARNGRRRAFELSSAVIQERERRRKRELKAHQDQQQGGGERKNPSENGSEIIDRADTYPDVLCWEESAVSTFGHGGIGIEIARRKKGGPGGRMLWKVGTRAGASH